MAEPTVEQVQKMIREECDSIRDLLISKNKKYGNSAVNPKRIFARSDAVEQIKVRIDDKLSRIQNMGLKGESAEEEEDACKDLIGYLILLRVAQRAHNEA